MTAASGSQREKCGVSGFGAVSVDSFDALGTYESWPLSDGDGNWSQVDLNWADIETCKQDYWNANRTFNPVKFNPSSWADLAYDCGFKYLLFTTKHHDGFCMFDTQTTDYKITDPTCPFHQHKDADIVAALYREFRARGMAISTYFSKPDWHSDAYWHRAFGNAQTRNVNYSIEKHPELWESYVQFVHTQLLELGTNYGKIDVLWLDGGWVNPDNLGQDIRLAEIVRTLRESTQEHLIVCDRTCGGEFENIITPEKTVPESAMHVPWETCETIGNTFSFHYDDEFKSGHKLVHLLLDVVSKGGNLALNIAPQPDGELPRKAVKSLRELGAWLKIFGEGIYQTKIQAPYFSKRLKYMTKANSIYVYFLFDEFDEAILPTNIELEVDADVLGIRNMRSSLCVPFRQEGSIVSLNCHYIPQAGAFFAEGFELSLTNSN